jgi:hypothetical protein
VRSDLNAAHIQTCFCDHPHLTSRLYFTSSVHGRNLESILETSLLSPTCHPSLLGWTSVKRPLLLILLHVKWTWKMLPNWSVLLYSHLSLILCSNSRKHKGLVFSSGVTSKLAYNVQSSGFDPQDCSNVCVCVCVCVCVWS